MQFRWSKRIASASTLAAPKLLKAFPKMASNDALKIARRPVLIGICMPPSVSDCRAGARLRNSLSDFCEEIVYVPAMKNFLFTALTLAALSTSAFAADKKDEKKSDYPLTTCIVSDEKLGSMGKPYITKVKG